MAKKVIAKTTVASPKAPRKKRAPKTAGKARTARKGKGSPFKLRSAAEAGKARASMVHVYGHGVICGTDERGHRTPRGRSPLELVIDTPDGVVPLWAEGSVLYWRFRESTLAAFEDPAAVKKASREVFAKAVTAWGKAAPVIFKEARSNCDFEIALRKADDCDSSGCVLASAFFPDAGRHELVLYPELFAQSEEEQVETLVHELGHVFGLRHFFAQVSETAWPSEIFGTHSKFSIMNYGPDSKLTAEDKADLRRLYRSAWSGDLKEINGTPIKFVRPYSAGAR